MPNEMSWNAVDKKVGMTLEELEDALAIVRSARPGVKWKVKATVGFSGQVQKITLMEVDDVAVPEAS